MRAFSYAWSLPVTWQRWWSQHSIIIAIAKNPMLHANLVALCFTQPELWSIKVLHGGNFLPLLLLWHWPWPNEPDPYSMEIVDIYRCRNMNYVKAFESYRLTDRQTGRQTDMTEVIHHTTSRVVNILKQDAQLSQRDRAAGCVIVFAKSRTLELGANDLRTL